LRISEAGEAADEPEAVIPGVLLILAGDATTFFNLDPRLSGVLESEPELPASPASLLLRADTGPRERLFDVFGVSEALELELALAVGLVMGLGLTLVVLLALLLLDGSAGDAANGREAVLLEGGG
jgi:hypothetical protein